MLDELIKEVKSLFCDEIYSNISFEINDCEICIYIDFDPEESMEENTKYKIVYDKLDKEVFLDTEYMKKHYLGIEYGLTYEDIEKIFKIMEYIKSNFEGLTSLMEGLSWTQRITEEQKKEDYRYK